MKSSFDKILNDVQMLSQRMRVREETANELLIKAENIHSHLEVMKQYQEETAALSKISRDAGKTQPKPVINGLAVENEQLEQLKLQNQDLDICLSEHQSALELIMSKYREQVTNLMESSKDTDITRHKFLIAQPPSNRQTRPSIELAKQALFDHRLAMMAQLAREVTTQSDLYSAELESDLYRLQTENAGLRDLLALSEMHADCESVGVGEGGSADKSDDGSTTPTEREPCLKSSQEPGVPVDQPVATPKRFLAENWPDENGETVENSLDANLDLLGGLQDTDFPEDAAPCVVSKLS